jgi:hypothetical protein
MAGLISLGSKLVTETAYSAGWCKRSKTNSNDPTFLCKNSLVGLTGPYSVHPIKPGNLVPFLLKRTKETGLRVKAFTKNALGIRMYDSIFRRRRLMLQPGDVITELLQKNCPVVCKIAGEVV